MIDVSRDFKQSIYAPIRKTTASIDFELYDNSAYEDYRATTNSNSSISNLGQISNKVRKMSDKFGTFERDYFRLDGSFKIPPSTLSTTEIGWWSDEICNANGVFSYVPELHIDFTSGHNSLGLTITFDTLNNEYATEFDILVYNSSSQLFKTINVKDNNKSQYVYRDGLDDYKKIVIKIYKWSVPFRRVRVLEVDYGIYQTYTENELVKVKLTEEMNVVGDTLPINELEVVIDNLNKDFNILNPQGFYRFLQERQHIKLTIGLELENKTYEYIDFQGYYLTDWVSDEGALTTTLRARNKFEIIDQEEIDSPAHINLYGLAQDILEYCGISEYEIDRNLLDIETNGFYEKINCRTALQMIALASKSAIYQDRKGKIIIKQFEVLDNQTTFINHVSNDFYAGTNSYFQVDKGWDMKNITFDNVFKAPQIQLDKLVRKLIVKVYPNGYGDPIEYSFYNGSVKDGITLTLDNELIQSKEQAEDVAEWILRESNLRALYTVNWRQNHALECGDIVLVEDSYHAKKQSRITYNQFEFAGYLKGQTKTKGGV